MDINLCITVVVKCYKLCYKFHLSFWSLFTKDALMSKLILPLRYDSWNNKYATQTNILIKCETSCGVSEAYKNIQKIIISENTLLLIKKVLSEHLTLFWSVSVKCKVVKILWTFNMDIDPSLTDAIDYIKQNVLVR